MPRLGALTGAVTLLGGGWLYGNNPDSDAFLRDLPTVKINDDDSLLAHWPSEDFGAPRGAPPECRWWSMKVNYDAGLCSHFTISRLSSTPARALVRASARAAAHRVECVLSPEVGLGVPAAFVNDHAEGALQMVLAPRLLPGAADAPRQHVRARPPDGDGLTDTRTFLFNKTVRAEFFDGVTKTMHTREFRGDAAFCVQLLRASFASACWERLD